LLKGNKISSEYMTNASVVAKFVEKQWPESKIKYDLPLLEL
jgi:hypothetical protein